MGNIRDVLGEIRQTVRAVAGDLEALQQIDTILGEALARIQNIGKR